MDSPNKHSFSTHTNPTWVRYMLATVKIYYGFLVSSKVTIEVKKKKEEHEKSPLVFNYLVPEVTVSYHLYEACHM